MPQQDSQLQSASLDLPSTLGFLGSLPFIGLALLLVQGFASGAGLQSTAVAGLYAPYVFIAYSAVILSFLCGTLWAVARASASSRLTAAAIILSNLLALSAWASLLMIYIAPIMTVFAVNLLLAGFLAVLWAERMVDGQQVASNRRYWLMRQWITAIVALSHILVIFMMIQEL
ncbi:MAG: DUF3429 domain-containing protein [Porticoccaceae bacterium]|nr:DUF3429 domain-containing protein [Porticoccaceae bacterium]